MSRYVLHGVDGLRRDLGVGSCRLVENGIVGLLGTPPSEVAARSNATRSGSQRKSVRYLARSGTLKIAINAGLPRAELLATEKQWWNAWAPDRSAILEVQTDGEPNRYLELYFEDNGETEFRFDPDLLGLYVATMRVTAHDPLWTSRADPIVFARNEPDADFFGRDEVHQQEGAPDYWLSASNLPITRRIHNRGDVAAPVVWTLTGPFDEFETVVDGRTLGGRFAVPDQQVLTIDSARKRARLWNGETEVSMWRQLTTWEFGYLQPGKAAEVAVRLEGTGSAVLEYTPQHLQARA